MKYLKIKNKKDLDLLKNKTAQFKNLTFSFSEKYLQSLKEELSEKNAFQMFAKDGDIFAGYIASVEKEIKPNFLWIVELFIDPKYQKQSVGTSLIKKVISEAKEKEMSGLTVQTETKNIPAQNLYKKIGFVEIDNPGWKEGPTLQLKFDN